MRIIIVGGGEVGFALSRDLSRDHGISVVDTDATVRERFEK
jgi:Trk K+ transport system NAD-binding subunit